MIAAVAMLLAIIGTLLEINFVTAASEPIDYRWIVGGVALGTVLGAFAAIRIPMTSIKDYVTATNAMSALWSRPKAPGESYTGMDTHTCFTAPLSISSFSSSSSSTP